MTRARDVANLIGSGNYSSTTFTATAGQTAFTISHTQGFVQVFMNGLLLAETVDYTSNGSAVTLTSGAAAGDEIEVVAYNTFSVGDALPKSGGTMSGDLVAGTRLQVGDSSITNAYGSNASLGYVADFQGSTGNQTFISIATPSASSLGDNGTVIGEDASDTYITQRGNKNIKLGTQNLNRLIVDGSGRVSMSYQPAFEAYVATGSATNLSSGIHKFSGSSAFNGHVFTSINFNIGSHFDSSTTRFTAPVAGRYLMYGGVATSSAASSSNYMAYEFYISGTRKADGWNAKPGGYHKETTWRIFSLSANDYVEPGYENASTMHVLSQGSTNNNYVYFGGYFLG